MLKHMTMQRQEHLDKIAKSKADGGQDDGAALETTRLRVLALISDMNMRNLLTSTPVKKVASHRGTWHLSRPLKLNS